MTPPTVCVKICGLTRPEDASAAARAGADAIGLNFVGGPRKINPDRAAAILQATPPSLAVWLLADVTNGDLPEPLKLITTRGRISHLQMYGSVTPPTLARLHGQGLRTVKVQPVGDESFVDQMNAWLSGCGPQRPDLVLLDAQRPQTSGSRSSTQGGTGCVLDWDMIAAQQSKGRLAGWPPIVLAGGLNSDNVAQAVRIVGPRWVDVSSGIETSPGCKDPRQIEAFVKAAKRLS